MKQIAKLILTATLAAGMTATAQTDGFATKWCGLVGLATKHPSPSSPSSPSSPPSPGGSAALYSSLVTSGKAASFSLFAGKELAIIGCITGTK